MSLRRRALIVNAALVVLLVGGVGVAFASLGSGGRAVPAPAGVEVTTGTVVASVSASGSIDSARTRALSFTGTGTVEAVRVKAGDRVKKGQVLARLDDTDAREALDAARAGLDAAEDADTTTPAGYSQYVSARNTYNQADRALDGTVLKAPFAATVTAVNGAVGDPASGGGASGGGGAKNAGSGDAGSASGSGSGSGSGGGSAAGGFVELADASRLQIVGDFTESDVTRLKTGQEATVTFDALPGVTATGKVTRISPTPQTVDNVVQYPVTVSLSKAPSGVRLGQTATLQVVVDEAEDVLVVPSTAVRTAGGQSTVLVVTGGGEQPRRVEIGVKGDQLTEITSGLRAGDRVVRQAEPADGGEGFPGGGGMRMGGGGR